MRGEWTYDKFDTCIDISGIEATSLATRHTVFIVVGHLYIEGSGGYAVGITAKECPTRRYNLVDINKINTSAGANYRGEKTRQKSAGQT